MILDYYLQPNYVGEEQKGLLRLIGVKPPDYRHRQKRYGRAKETRLIGSTPPKIRIDS